MEAEQGRVTMTTLLKLAGALGLEPYLLLVPSDDKGTDNG
jgi:hypothetical protein